MGGGGCDGEEVGEVCAWDINDGDASRRPIPLANGQNLGFHPWCDGLASIYNDGGLAVGQLGVAVARTEGVEEGDDVPGHSR